MGGTFLGVGLGPIQTGIFLSGAARGGFDRLVVADVDGELVQAVQNNSGSIQISIATEDTILTETITGIEIYNPTIPEDAAKLAEAAADADEVATALPSVNFFKYLDWMTQGFSQQPKRPRFIYAAENHNHAAEKLEQAVGRFSGTHYLNTVIGKMSCILPAAECAHRNLPKLAPTADRGHLVEEYNNILIQSCEGIASRRIESLYDKSDLLPFEEAKLYGHNAVHFWLGVHANKNRLRFMHELADDIQLIKKARVAFVNEAGAALCKKWEGVDELFTASGFSAYADNLLTRMVNPFLTDRVDRVCRDMERKLGWDDRIIGAMRLVLHQDFKPSVLAEAAAIAARDFLGNDSVMIRSGFQKIWGRWDDECERLWELIKFNYDENETHKNQQFPQSKTGRV